jgi:hypothetical protein
LVACCPHRRSFDYGAGDNPMTLKPNMIERACMAAWPDAEAVTDEMRSRMRAAIAVMQEALQEEIAMNETIRAAEGNDRGQAS